MISRQDKGRKGTEIRAHHILSAYHSALTSDVKEVEDACQDGGASGQPQGQVGQKLAEDARLEVQGAGHEVEASRQAEVGDQDDQGREAVDAEEGGQESGQEDGADDGDRLGGDQHGVEPVAAAVVPTEVAVALQLVGGLGGASFRSRTGVVDLGHRGAGHGVFAFSEGTVWIRTLLYI